MAANKLVGSSITCFTCSVVTWNPSLSAVYLNDISHTHTLALERLVRPFILRHDSTGLGLDLVLQANSGGSCCQRALGVVNLLIHPRSGGSAEINGYQEWSIGICCHWNWKWNGAFSPPKFREMPLVKQRLQIRNHFVVLPDVWAVFCFYRRWIDCCKGCIVMSKHWDGFWSKIETFRGGLQSSLGGRKVQAAPIGEPECVIVRSCPPWHPSSGFQVCFGSGSI